MPQMGWNLLLAVLLLVALMPRRAAAFGAGNIPSIAQVEGVNWRHGDIEDMLKTVAFLHGKKWTTMMVQRTYFGNWLRDYSQAVDVGSLKGGVNAATIRILIWVLSFLAFGYATEEFEVTEERLGVYRPEEHIDNPLGYADGLDARKFDPRLRGPVDPRELEIDPETGMKNYIANEKGGGTQPWATSSGYLRFSFARSIHFGRLYLHGGSGKAGKEADLCEALRCLGQALHCMEDFSAHSNYCELALRELGYNEVFAHCGANTEINLRGRRVFPLVTGTFGAVDFLHSVLGEANDHFTQSEVDEVDIALKNAESMTGGSTGSRGLFGPSSGGSGGGDFISLVSQIPGIGGGFAAEADKLRSASEAQERENTRAANANVVPGMSANFDPVETARKIYPILEFRDRIVKSINGVIAKIPGLEKLIEHISETLSAFVLGLLAPFVRPIIKQVTKVLKDGSSGVINASANTQLEPWKDPNCSNPTHSMLSKDHFTNILNPCAGRVAATVLQYVVPRVLYAWDHPNVPVDEVANDVLRALHHPAIRNDQVQIQREMFETVRRWAAEHPRKNELNHLLSSECVKHGGNHSGGENPHTHGSGGCGGGGGSGGSSSWSNLSSNPMASALFSQFKTRDLSAMDGRDGPSSSSYQSTSPAPTASSVSPGFGYSRGNNGGPSAAPTGGAASSYLQGSYGHSVQHAYEQGGQGGGQGGLYGYSQGGQGGQGYAQSGYGQSGYSQGGQGGQGYGQQAYQQSGQGGYPGAGYGPGSPGGSGRPGGPGSPGNQGGYYGQPAQSYGSAYETQPGWGGGGPPPPPPPGYGGFGYGGPPPPPPPFGQPGPYGQPPPPPPGAWGQPYQGQQYQGQKYQGQQYQGQQYQGQQYQGRRY